MSLTFTSDGHLYHYDGQVVPSVTSILSPLTNYSAVPPAVLQAASDFGTAVHMAAEMDDNGYLDESTVDAALVPYLDAWRKFSADHAVQWQLIERPLYHSTLRYAGTPDRVGLVDGVSTVLDIKTTAQLYPSVGPQLAAYKDACYHDHRTDHFAELAKAAKPVQRMAVQLKGDGTYSKKVYTDPTDWPVFVSLLTLRTWCARHSITPDLIKESL